MKEGRHLYLTTKTFDLLQFLIENYGNVVSKDEILGVVWRGEFVEESNLTVHISKLRRRLGETRANRFIETVHGIGYRFVAPVETVNVDIWRRTVPDIRSFQANVHGEVGRPAVDSIVVLPFESEVRRSGAEHVADGLTESITHSLSLIPGLKVIPRSTAYRYKDHNPDALEVGQALRVAAVLTGRIRTSSDRIFVSVELVDVVEGAQLWGKQFQGSFEEVVQIKMQLSTFVGDRLRGNGSQASVFTDGWISPSVEPDSYYPKPPYFDREKMDELSERVDRYERSLHHDPTNLNVYVKLVDCYRRLHVLHSARFRLDVDHGSGIAA